MASAYRCDRCGNYYQQIGYLPPDYCVCRSNGLIKAGVKLDLCPDCGKILEDWMNDKSIILIHSITKDCPEYVSRLEYPADEVDDE